MSIRPWMKAAALAIASIVATAACSDTPPEGTPTGSTSASTTGGGVSTSSSAAGTGGASGDGGASDGGGGAGGDGGASDGGGGAAPDCSTDPTTHEEIINACTDAEQVDKQPNLPLLNADGSLPPLP